MYIHMELRERLQPDVHLGVFTLWLKLKSMGLFVFI